MNLLKIHGLKILVLMLFIITGFQSYQISSLNNEIQSLESNINSSIEVLEDKTANLDPDIQLLPTTITNLKDEIDKLSNHLNELQSNFDYATRYSYPSSY